MITYYNIFKLRFTIINNKSKHKNKQSLLLNRKYVIMNISDKGGIRWGLKEFF